MCNPNYVIKSNKEPKRMEVLKGKKTYIVAILIGCAAVAKQLGYIDEQTHTLIITLLTGTGLATLRAGVSK